ARRDRRRERLRDGDEGAGLRAVACDVAARGRHVDRARDGGRTARVRPGFGGARVGARIGAGPRIGPGPRVDAAGVDGAGVAPRAGIAATGVALGAAVGGAVRLAAVLPARIAS